MNRPPASNVSQAVGSRRLRAHMTFGVTADCVVFGFDGAQLKIALIQRDVEPYAGRWALPGGFVGPEERLEEAAIRALAEETGIGSVFLEQLYTFGGPHRDPRARIVTVAYYALVKLSGHSIHAAADARRAEWFAIADMPRLAFDHDGIVQVAINRLKSKVRYQPVGFELLPPKFKLSQLQQLYEGILGRPLDKRNFRRKLLAMGILRELDEVEKDVAHRAARLYSFDRRRYEKLGENGFNFEI